MVAFTGLQTGPPLEGGVGVLVSAGVGESVGVMWSVMGVGVRVALGPVVGVRVRVGLTVRVGVRVTVSEGPPVGVQVAACVGTANEALKLLLDSLVSVSRFVGSAIAIPELSGAKLSVTDRPAPKLLTVCVCEL